MVVGNTPQEAMEFYHKAETFYLRAPAYELNQILPDGRVSELGLFCDTHGETDTRRFSPEARALVGLKGK